MFQNISFNSLDPLKYFTSNIEKTNDFVKNLPSNSNLSEKLSRLHKNCIDIKNPLWQIIQNGISVFVS